MPMPAHFEQSMNWSWSPSVGRSTRHSRRSPKHPQFQHDTKLHNHRTNRMQDNRSRAPVVLFMVVGSRCLIRDVRY